MFPSEMVILMAIAGGRDISKKPLTRPMDITGEYIGYLYNSLVKRGYITGNRLRGYQLTYNGRETLFEFLHENRTRAKDTIKTLRQLGIEINQEIDRIEKEIIASM
jgi:predicted transcriptional regulator